MVAQQVIDRRPLEDVAARGVDMQVDLGQVAHCLEVSSELQRGDAPDADLVVQQHLGDAATGSLNAVPGLMRGVGLSQRRRHRQHQVFMDQGLMALGKSGPGTGRPAPYLLTSSRASSAVSIFPTPRYTFCTASTGSIPDLTNWW